MVNEKYSSEDIKEIIDGVIEEINVGKTKIFHIADAMRDELEIKKKELYDIKSRLSKVINEVDYLEKADKAMRYKLVEEYKKIISGGFGFV